MSNHTLCIEGVPAPSENYAPTGGIVGNGDLCLVGGSETDAPTFYVNKPDFWKALSGDRSDGGIKPIARLRFAGMDTKTLHTEQRMDEGLLVLSSKDAEVCIFVDPDVSRAVLRITCAPDAADVTPELSVFSGCGSISLLTRTESCTLAIRRFAGENLLFPCAACAVLRQLPRTKQSERTFVLSCVTDQQTAAYRHEALLLSQNADADDVRARHDAWWARFWDRSCVRLSDARIELHWYAGLYLLACCCGSDRFPPGLYGCFLRSDDVPWGGDYHLNYNYEAPFYGVFSANHPALAAGYPQPLLDFMPEGRRNAEAFLKCRGVYYPVGIGPRGMNTSHAPSKEHNQLFLGQKSDAAYGAIVLILQWNATRDTAFARRVYPYLRAVADFFEDYMRFDGDAYHIDNDAIHEVPFYRADFEWGCEDDRSDDSDNLLSLGLTRALFVAVADMASVLGTDEDRLETWRHIASHIAPFPTYTRSGRTVYRYTRHGQDWDESNSLCIQHIFPAGQVGLCDDDATLEVARNTFFDTDRSLDGNGANSYLPAGARIGVSGTFLRGALHGFYDAYLLPNGLFDLGGGCLEHNGMTVTTVDEMLLQSHQGIVRLFPVWRDDASFLDLRADGAFLVSASQTDGRIADVRIFSEKGMTLRVLNPYKKAALHRQDGTITYWDTSVIETPTHPGETLRIEEAQ
jgi:hypothetical protein